MQSDIKILGCCNCNSSFFILKLDFVHKIVNKIQVKMHKNTHIFSTTDLDRFTCSFLLQVI